MPEALHDDANGFAFEAEANGLKCTAGDAEGAGELLFDFELAVFPTAARCAGRIRPSSNVGGVKQAGAGRCEKAG